MNISLAFSDFPAPHQPFRVYCFIACGYLAEDGTFTDSFDDAMIFPPDSFQDSLEFAERHIAEYVRKHMDFLYDVGIVRANLDATIFVQFTSLHTQHPYFR